jgi:RNase adaptor protein for sRNA GlmZ degradation
MPKKPPKPPQVPLSLVMAAVEAAALSAAQRARFDTVIERGKPRRGHPLTDDDALLAKVKALMAEGLAEDVARARAALDLPESARNAAKKRLRNKMKAEKESQQVTVPRKSLARGSGAPPRSGLSAEERAMLEQMRMKKS